MTPAPPTFIDAHHHFWDLGHCYYPWLMAKGEKRFFGDPTPIQKNYLPDDLLGESSVFVPAKTVHIQVGVAAADEVKETAWLQSLAPCPQAIVAATDLRAADLAQHLDAHAHHSRLRGVRQIIGRHADEDSKHGSDALLEDPAFVGGLRTLEARNLSFDLQMIPPQMPRVLAVLRDAPGLKVALCHAGSPWDQSPSGLANWRKGLRSLAQLPNVQCKLSGLGMFNRNWQEADLRPIILDVIEIFGPGRVMFGSNFPVDKLYKSYEQVWQCYSNVTASFSASERKQMFYSTAAEFYRI